MVRRKKICAGCEQETYIYKNIDGKKYCKSCTFKIQPVKVIKKVSNKQVFKLTLKKELLQVDREFYLSLWYKTFGRVKNTADESGLDNVEVCPKCECCGTRLWFEPNLMYFHHILEKRNYPEYRHKEWNIAILCSDCHSRYESNPDNVPYLKMKKEKLLKEILF